MNTVTFVTDDNRKTHYYPSSRWVVILLYYSNHGSTSGFRSSAAIWGQTAITFIGTAAVAASQRMRTNCRGASRDPAPPFSQVAKPQRKLSFASPRGLLADMLRGCPSVSRSGVSSWRVSAGAWWRFEKARSGGYSRISQRTRAKHALVIMSSGFSVFQASYQ